MKLEDQIKRLDEITAILEGGTCTLDEGIKLYEEGGEIAKQCYKTLNEAKGKMTVIKKELETYKEEV